jgi:hexosaminidase
VVTSTLGLLPVPRYLEVGDGMAATMREPIITRNPSLPAEGYELHITSAAITIVAADAAAEFYAAATLAQLLQPHPGDALPVVSIRDWPDLPVRGVMLDVSRDKVPTMDTLYALIDRLASWKVNQVQLYMEHTFAYHDHEDVWRAASPFTPDEIRALDSFCRERHVELVPNQNCLGHMERWLAHDRYRPLAMRPEGFTDDLGRRRGPTTIEATNPASIDLVSALLHELLANFTSRRVHVGLDEPWELGAERMDDYIAWARTVSALPELDGYEVLVWGDILAGRKELISALPDTVTVCEWGYDDWYPFDERAAALAAAGRRFWVCPGTSSWLTILGRVTNMRDTCTSAMDAALAHRASGFLNTDWGDFGHLQYLPISEPGFAYGAAVSWCVDTNRDLDLAAALDAHRFDDETGELGAALVELGDLYLAVTPQVPNVSALVLHLYFPQLHLDRGPTKSLTVDELHGVATRLDSAEARIARSRPAGGDGVLVREELRNAIALVRVLVHDGIARLGTNGSLESIPPEQRHALAGELRPVIAEHPRLWLARNRPGGLDDSCARLENLLRGYETSEAGPPPAT